jgi:hypothetical protein
MIAFLINCIKFPIIDINLVQPIKNHFKLRNWQTFYEVLWNNLGYIFKTTKILLDYTGKSLDKFIDLFLLDSISIPLSSVEDKFMKEW